MTFFNFKFKIDKTQNFQIFKNSYLKSILVIC